MVSNSDSEFQLALQAKRGKILTVKLQTVSKNVTFAKELKYFSTSMNSRSLPQNKALFDSDQLVKFVIFAQKNVPTIRARSNVGESRLSHVRPTVTNGSD